ncbi:hypothetical protein C8R41DRAFT_839866 [Lentinula lateritia]|uniref:Secreted protein n=1 Tax=Lentinula lateritia TaxID=40482 RepID=A0ABQ8VCE7_9AGAR|nr:hypothetical protein C8R41DRAFT_839866 [Lentinula lateritia]
MGSLRVSAVRILTSVITLSRYVRGTCTMSTRGHCKGFYCTASRRSSSMATCRMTAKKHPTRAISSSAVVWTATVRTWTSHCV